MEFRLVCLYRTPAKVHYGDKDLSIGDNLGMGVCRLSATLTFSLEAVSSLLVSPSSTLDS